LEKSTSTFVMPMLTARRTVGGVVSSTTASATGALVTAPKLLVTTS
jgi:hypothetical protein